MPSALHRLLVTAALLLALPVAAAADDETEAIKKHYTRGMAHYRLNEYKEAVEEFSAAYRMKADPVFLYNIAQAWRLAKRHAEALEFYEKYLKSVENPPNRAEVEIRIRDLRKLIQDAGNVEGGNPTDPLPLTPKAEPPKPEPPKVEVPPAALQADLQAEAPRPAYKKWWFWTVGAVVVAAIGAGIGLGIALSSSPAERLFPDLVAQ